MKKQLICAVCLFLLLSACGKTEINETAPTPIPEPSPTAAILEDVHQAPVETPTGDWEPPFVLKIDSKFTLTDVQQELFDRYSKDFNFDISIFKDASPIDIAHVFIECGIHGFWEGEYNLFYFDKNTVSKAEYKAESEQDLEANDLRNRRAFADILYPFLKEGTFVDAGDDSGYIEFVSIDSDYVNVYETKAKMNLKKVDGIWMINQNNPFEAAD